MSVARRIFVICLLPSLGACNMLISETAMFSDDDRAQVLPQDGIWLSKDKDCEVDGGMPESYWPECALWVVVRGAGTDILLMDGKGQSESIGWLLAAGDPIILQGRWIDTAKPPHRSVYGFYGIDPLKIGPDGRLLAVSVWPVECGTESGHAVGIGHVELARLDVEALGAELLCRSGALAGVSRSEDRVVPVARELADHL